MRFLLMVNRSLSESCFGVADVVAVVRVVGLSPPGVDEKKKKGIYFERLCNNLERGQNYLIGSQRPGACGGEGGLGNSLI